MNALRIRILADALTTFVCGLSLVLILARLGSPARPVLVLAGLVIGSGWALVGWIDLRDDFSYVAAITLAVGVAAPIAISVVLVESNWWHPVGDSAAILAGAAALNLGQLLRDGRKARLHREEAAA